MMELSEQIKQIDLVALAESAGVELRQVGSNHTGLCPLHGENNPSFYIYPNNRWKCYGCGEGGDAADLVQGIYQCDFSEALRRLGIQGGLTKKEKFQIKQRQRLKARRIQRERDLIFTLAILIRAAHKCSEFIHLLPCWEWYHDVLARGTREEKDEVIRGLKDWPTISRRYLFEPDFNYRQWLHGFLHNDQKGVKINNTGEENATSSKKQNNHLRSVS